MLKDITLGQFFPGNTPIHRLDPRTKLLCVILYIVALFNAKGPLTYGIMIVVLAVCILLSKVEWKALTRGLKPVYIIVAFTAIMNMFFTTGTPVADVWLLRHITWQGIISAVQMGAAHRDAHHGHVPHDLYHQPHCPHRRTGEPAGPPEEAALSGA